MDYVSIISAVVSGGIITIIYESIKNRIQKITCYVLHNEAQSKLPVVVDNDKKYDNLYSIKYELVNSTSKNYENLVVMLSFDSSSIIHKVNTQSYLGYDKIRVSRKRGECTLNTKVFNKGDKVIVELMVANVTDNRCNAIIENIPGVRIKMSERKRSKSQSVVRLSKEYSRK